MDAMFVFSVSGAFLVFGTQFVSPGVRMRLCLLVSVVRRPLGVCVWLTRVGAGAWDM